MLLQMLANGMPHKLKDRNTQCLYLNAMFTIAESPAGRPIRDGLLAAILEHVLTIDVEIKWQNIMDTPEGTWSTLMLHSQCCASGPGSQSDLTVCDAGVLFR